jgi:superfamily II DNA or RNA helicase
VISNLDINCIQFKYAKEECDTMKRKTYQEEIDYIISHERRNKVAEKLCASLKGNTLVLFSQVQKHGLPFFESIQKTCTDKKCYFISGMTDAEDREQIRKIVDKSENSILVASYGTCSTGINIKNIHNIVFLHPSKSVVRVLQSIGRGLRMSETKDRVMVFDLVDDLRHKKYRNHAFNHFLERIKIYDGEQFSHKLVTIDL